MNEKNATVFYNDKTSEAIEQNGTHIECCMI
jgi:hypothetical protein